MRLSNLESNPLRPVENRPLRVSIVGSGLAGLACGALLTERGHEVSLYEARNRVGGRVQTERDAAGKVLFEAGAEFVAKRHSRWHALAREHNLVLADAPPPATLPIIVNGKELSKRESYRIRLSLNRSLADLPAMANHLNLEKPWLAPDALDLDCTSVADWSSQLFLGETESTALAGYLEGLNAVPLKKQSLLAHLVQVKADGSGDADEDSFGFRCKDGNDALVAALREKIVGLGGKIYLSQPVAKIDPAQGSLWLKSGNRQDADVVTLATPPSTWDQLILQGGWPHETRPQMGLAAKLAVIFDAMPSKQNKVEHLGEHYDARGTVWESWSVPSFFSQSQTVMGFFPTYAYRLELGQQFVAQLTLRAPSRTSPTVKLYDWQQEPFSRGGYPFPAPGEVTTWGPTLATSYQGRMFFAGDYTDYANIDYMEGAIRSGEKAARRILQVAGEK